MEKNRTEKVQKFKLKKVLNKKWIILNICFALIFVGVIFLGYWLSTQNKTTSIVPSKNSKINKTINDVQNLVDSGETDSAVGAYDAAIKNASSSDEKISILLAKAAIYLNQNEFETAIKIGKEAEAISVTFATTDFLATAYELSGDLNLAMQYYEKTIPLINKKVTSYDDEVKYYQRKIASLNEELRQ